jgi:hypothetical protein
VPLKTDFVDTDVAAVVHAIHHNALATAVNQVATGQATVNFGASSQEDSISRVTVSTALAVTASIISVTPSGKATADHDPDDYQWDNITGYPTNIVNGVSFDVVGVAPGGAWGQYIFNYAIN